MKTSSTETIAIEQYLQGTQSPEDALLFEANLLLNPSLSDTVKHQQQTYALVQTYGRRRLKAELEAIHQRLFTEPAHRSFRNKVLSLFRKE